MIQPKNEVSPLKTRLERRLEEIARQVYLPACQIRLYEEYLSDDERLALFKPLFDDAKEAQADRENLGKEYLSQSEGQQFIGNGSRNILRVAKMRDIMAERLILDLAYEFGLLTGEPEYRRLIQEFCGEDHHVPSNNICYANGELRRGDFLVRKIKQYVHRKTNMELILTSFQEVGWRESRIDFSSALTTEQSLQSAVKDLNRGMRGMRFFSHGGGKIVSWVLTSMETECNSQTCLKAP